MSGRDYDTSKFENRVELWMAWSPFTCTSHSVLGLHDNAYLSLKYNSFTNKLQLVHPENVVVVHCNAGKGRTGTLISCYLIFSGLASNAKDAI